MSGRTCNNLDRRAGFTLFEMMLVLGILVVLAAMIYPSLDAMYGGYRLTASADQVRAAWASARAHAMDDGRAYRFAVVPGKGNFRVAPDSPEYWAGNGGSPSDADLATQPLILEEALKGIGFTTLDAVPSGGLDQGADSVLPLGSVDPNQWTTVATFLPDGTARDDVTIVLEARGARPVVLTLRGLTGFVKMTSFRVEARP